MIKSLLLAVVLVGTVSAQDCPVRVTHVMHDRNTEWNWSFLTVSFVNTSDKRLASTSFGAVVLDSAGEPHPLLAELRSGKKVKPGGKVSSQRLGPIGREVLDPHTQVKLRTWVQSVQFRR
jgi:hypothetical protein